VGCESVSDDARRSEWWGCCQAEERGGIMSASSFIGIGHSQRHHSTWNPPTSLMGQRSGPTKLTGERQCPGRTGIYCNGGRLVL
jgi:hypothetical protein